MDNTQIGIRTTGENKDFFNSLEGANQHDKFEILKRAYQEKLSKEEEFNINSYLIDAENTFNNFKSILNGLEGAFSEYKKKVYTEYVLNIGNRLVDIEEDLKDITIIKEQKKALEDKIEGQLKEITKLNNKINELMKENDLLKNKNNEFKEDLIKVNKDFNKQFNKTLEFNKIIDDLKNENVNLNNNLYKLETEIEFKDDKINDLINENAELKEDNKKLLQEIKEIEKTNYINFNLKCQELNDVKLEKAKILSKLEQLESKNKQNQYKPKNNNNNNKNKTPNK